MRCSADFAISEYNGARLEMPDAIDEYFGEGPKPTLGGPRSRPTPVAAAAKAHGSTGNARESTMGPRCWRAGGESGRWSSYLDHIYYYLHHGRASVNK